MRVISGSAKGKRLKSPDSLNIRPTSDRVKEAIFSIIRFELAGSVVLDLFSGTGQLGIEALSCGASKCVFIDGGAAAVGITAQNVASAGFSYKSEIKRYDYAHYLKTCKTVFDVAFLDPPYHTDCLQNALSLLPPLMSNRGAALCEHDGGLVLQENYGNLFKDKNYRYGQTMITVYRIRKE